MERILTYQEMFWSLDSFNCNGCLLYTPIFLLTPKKFNGLLVFSDHIFRGKVFD